MTKPFESFFINVVNDRIEELRHLVSSPIDHENDKEVAEQYGLTVEEYRGNEIANKMIEVKALTHFAFLTDSGLKNEHIDFLVKIDDECNELMQTHCWALEN